MDSFSPEFLRQIADEKGLSQDQQDVFIPRFSGNKGYDEIADKLNTSRDACLKRMSLVYKKFDIDGAVRGKEARLKRLLNDLTLVDDSMHQLQLLCIEAKKIQSDPSRYITAEPFTQQALIKLLLDKFIVLLPHLVKNQALDKRLSFVVDIITKADFILSEYYSSESHSCHVSKKASWMS